MALPAFFEDLSLTGWLVVGVFSAWLLWYLNYLYNALVVSPLRKVPGPLSYIIFGQYAMLWERYFAMGGHVPHQVRSKQHYKYGPVVRTSANGVSVADPDLAIEILVKKDYPKSEAAALLFKPLNPDALVAITDKAEHRRTRRFMSQRFSVQGIAKMEWLMQLVYKALEARLEKEIAAAGGRARLNMWDLLHCAGIDTIGETAFGQTFNSMAAQHARVVELVEDTFKYISITSAFPPMRNFGFLPVNTAQDGRIKEMAEICTKILKQRRLDTGTDKERDDIVQLLVSGKFPDGTTMDDYHIITNMLGMLTAGSDSTSGAMGFTFIETLRHPEWIPKIQAEVDAAPLDEKGLITAQTARDTMPTFQACIKETLRMYTGRDFQRVAPEDVELKGYVIPQGAEVNVARYALHRGPWWTEPDSYKPERFLGADGISGGDKDEDVGKGMYAPFSLGVRNCIGMNFAWQEMRVVLSNLFRNYEFEDIPGQNTETGIYVNIMLKTNKYDCWVKKRTPKAAK